MKEKQLWTWIVVTPFLIWIFVAVFLLFLSLASTASALPYEILLPKELNFDIEKTYLPLGTYDPKNNYTIYIRYVYSRYVNWRGLFTPNLIQINLYHIYGEQELQDVFWHEVNHYECWRDYHIMDYQHKVCKYN